MKILHLTLKKKWFDMIASGEKKEEYREIKPYWWSRLVQCGEIYKMDSYDEGASELLPVSEWKMIMAKGYSYIELKNGYSRSAPTLMVECLGISIGEGNPDWGAEPGKQYFVIKLGKII